MSRRCWLRSGQTMALWGCLLTLCWIVPAAGAGAADFIRGDSNGDRTLDISDGVFTLNYLFLGGAEPPCLAAADSNDDEEVDISDGVKVFGFLFLGDPPLPAPGPKPGPDPTPGLDCGLSPPTIISCSKKGPAVDLSFTSSQRYDSIRIARDGVLAATLPGDATSYRDRPPEGGDHLYAVSGVRGGRTTDPAACRVTGLPQNQPPSLTILAPAQGAIVNADSVEISGRVSDETAVERIYIFGVNVTPAGPPQVPYNFNVTIPLASGPNLIGIEVVDDFGRTTWKDLALGRRPIVEVRGASDGLALDLSGSSGYDEVENIVRPFLSGVPALLDSGIRGALLYQGSILGVDIRVTGNHVEVATPIGFDLFPSSAGGGRVGLTVNFTEVRLYADGVSDYGFLGDDAWTATWTGRNVAIAGTLAWTPKPDRTGLDVISDGFTATIGSSSLSVNGFLDPFGIFDGLVNFLADMFRGEIESQVKQAVEDTTNRELLPVLAEAFSNLNLSMNLGPVSLSTLFHDVLESPLSLSFLFDTIWQGAARDPAFPPYPGSHAELAPFPGFPLAAGASHPVDATFALSEDMLQQALFEYMAGGALTTEMGLSGLESPLPLNVGTLAQMLDPRLESLPGVAGSNPLGVRVEARFPAEVRLNEGVLGTPLVAAGAEWRYAKGISEPPAAWKTSTFDDASWVKGNSGFGYSSDPSELRGILTRLPDMADGDYISLYTRVKFRLTSPAALRGIFLHVLCDDGFVAYLNGQEVARVNMGGTAGTPPRFGDPAATAVEPAWTLLDLAPYRGSLRAGDNVLAIQGHNAGASSSDFVLLAELLEPAAPPAGTLSSLPAQIEISDLLVTFLADTAEDGVGSDDLDGRADEVVLFAYGLSLRLQTRLILFRDGNGMPVMSFEMQTEDGPDPDSFPDGLVGGAAGLDIKVAREAFDSDDALLLELADLVIALFGQSLGEALVGFEFPAFPLPELAFDLDENGAVDVRLEIQNATLTAVDTTGDGRSDWMCILSNLRAVSP